MTAGLPMVLVCSVRWSMMSCRSCLKEDIGKKFSWIPRFVAWGKLRDERLKVRPGLVGEVVAHPGTEWPSKTLLITTTSRCQCCARCRRLSSVTPRTDGRGTWMKSQRISGRRRWRSGLGRTSTHCKDAWMLWQEGLGEIFTPADFFDWRIRR